MPLTLQQIECFASLGYNLYREGKFKDARQIFQGLISIAPDSFYGYAGLGTLALASNPPDLDSALANLKYALELNANDPSTHANLGEALLQQGKPDEASVEFRKAWSCFRAGRLSSLAGIRPARGWAS